MTHEGRGSDAAAGLTHPIIDADGHFVEVAPLLNEEMLAYLEEMGGPRSATGTPPTPASPTRRPCSPATPGRRAAVGRPCRRGGAGPPRTPSTARPRICPALLYERLDEIGIDFTILYPSMTLAYLEVADDELIGLRCRAANRALANLFAPYRDRTTVGALDPDARSRSSRSTSSSSRCASSASRRPCSRATRARDRIGTDAYRLDTFGVDSVVRLRPAVGEVRRARHRAGVPQLAPVAPRHPLGDELRLQPRGWAGGEPRVAVQVAVPLGRHASLPHACASASSKAASRGRAACSATSSAIGRSATRDAIRVTRSRPPRRRRVARACSSATATTACTPGSDELRAYFSRPSARPEQLDEFAAAALESVADLRDRFVPELLLRLRGRRPARRLGVRGAASTPAGARLAADLRLRHLALGRARHDRTGRGGLRARRARR